MKIFQQGNELIVIQKRFQNESYEKAIEEIKE